MASVYTVCAAVPEYSIVAPGLLNEITSVPIADKPDNAVAFASCKVAVIVGVTVKVVVVLALLVVVCIIPPTLAIPPVRLKVVLKVEGVELIS